MNTRSLNNNDRTIKMMNEKSLKLSPHDSIQSSYHLKAPLINKNPQQNPNTKKKLNQLVMVDTSVERKSKKGTSSKMHREVSFRKASSIAESESQYSVKDSVR